MLTKCTVSIKIYNRWVRRVVKSLLSELALRQLWSVAACTVRRNSVPTEHQVARLVCCTRVYGFNGRDESWNNYYLIWWAETVKFDWFTNDCSEHGNDLRYKRPSFTHTRCLANLLCTLRLFFGSWGVLGAPGGKFSRWLWHNIMFDW